ncbi:MAG: response regulator [Limisphaerales bacterium]
MNGQYLIVDDEPDLCWALGHLLTSNGLPCHTAQTAQGALDLMKTHHFQLAFLDITLPDMNGLNLARCLRKLDPLLPIVILSGYLPNEAAAAAAARHEGLICAYFNKPFVHEEILHVVEEFLPRPS